MAYYSQIISIFVSSPGDVLADRQVVLDEMQAWNQRNARNRGCFLTALTWEDLVSPDMAGSSQDVINVEVGDDYDVFLGLMWGRFGTPTAKASSGTKEEFERALNRKESGDTLRISFLFRKSDIPFDDIDTKQLALVKEFKEDISAKGAFYGQYSDERELTSALTTLFDRISNEKERYTERQLGDSEGVSGALAIETRESEEGAEEIDLDAGLLDLEDDLTKYAGQLSTSLESWAAEFVKLNAEVRATTSNLTALSQFGQPDRVAVRSEIESITGGFARFSSFASSEIIEVEDNLEGMYRSLNGILNLSKEFDFEKGRKAELISQFSDLGKNIDDADGMLNQYIETMVSLPRIEKRFNLARNSVVTVHKQLRKKLRDFRERLSKIVVELEKM